MPLQASRETVELLSAARVEFDGMVKALNERMGETAPAMLGLRRAFEDCQLLAQQILQLNVSATPTEVALDAEPASAGATGVMPATEPGSPAASRHAITRAQIYTQLAEAANMLRRLEPHSPIPYLLERAVTLGALSFPDLMKELVRDANVLAAMSRELGIKEPSQDQ
jgi:type VI secretion system protein ImpA